MRNAFIIALIGVLAVGIITLQVFLSRKKSKWYGLILPFMCFWFSLFIIYSPAIMTVGAISGVHIASSQGVIGFDVDRMNNGIFSLAGTMVMDKISVVFLCAAVMVACNIPTAVLLFIYFVCRKKEKKYAELQKMSAQDLE